MNAAEAACGACQRRFHARWGHLNDPHVRTLAWLLDAPDMLDRAAPQWQGRLASLGEGAATDVADWLAALDAAPEDLHAFLAVHRYTRLGRYAEQLLTLYFRHQGWLLKQGMQVRQGNLTVGEFDFLLRQDGRLLHRELATKVYLLRGGSHGPGEDSPDYFVGPNLADTLGKKINKILGRQLALSAHPAAAAVLSAPVDEAAALVKGWLFYPEGEAHEVPGLNPDHCRGSWRSETQFRKRGFSQRYLVLHRLQWLAPQKCSVDQTLTQEEAQVALEQAFASQGMPVMLAAMEEGEYGWMETARGFVVPDTWLDRSAGPTLPVFP